jgi:YegS/Rv2252/BmrU family lipid kinase
LPPPSSSRVAIIINPISGTGGRRGVLRDRVSMAGALAQRHGLDPLISVSERPGHIRELAQSALDAGATAVLAWGGDGTINEIGSVLAFRHATLGIIPSGSGNGLARELRIPLTAPEAFAVALGGDDRVIDCGELDGHLFFNIAGIGVDARIAHEFAAHGLERRGFRRYLEIGARELFRYRPDAHTIRVDAGTVRSHAMLIAIANGRQYGNGALIAPHARLDDGQLDVVIVEHRPAWRALVQVPQVFLGKVDRVSGVTIVRGERIEITSGRPMIYHCDGETHVGGAVVRARVHPAALRVRVAKALSTVSV